MKRDFLTELGLETEQVDKIMAEHGKTINSYKTDAEGKAKEVDDLSKQLKDRDKQLEELSKKASGNEDLQKQIADLQEANKQTAKDYQDKLNKQAFEFALERSLADAQAKNPKAVKALLNAEAIKLDGDKLLGLEEQLKALKESDSYLFAETTPTLSGRKPHVPVTPGNKGITKEQFGQMSYTERVNLYNENPDLYNQLNN